jgi:hypothetical protein
LRPLKNYLAPRTFDGCRASYGLRHFWTYTPPSGSGRKGGIGERERKRVKEREREREREREKRQRERERRLRQVSETNGPWTSEVPLPQKEKATEDDTFARGRKTRKTGLTGGCIDVVFLRACKNMSTRQQAKL